MKTHHLDTSWHVNSPKRPFDRRDILFELSKICRKRHLTKCIAWKYDSYNMSHNESYYISYLAIAALSQVGVLWNNWLSHSWKLPSLLNSEVPTVVEIISYWLWSIILLTRTARRVKAYSSIVSHCWPQASFWNIQSFLHFEIIE